MNKSANNAVSAACLIALLFFGVFITKGFGTVLYMDVKIVKMAYATFDACVIHDCSKGIQK